MQACPVPLSSTVTIAELNEASNTNTPIPAHVASFTDACVLCELCVPVCPVGDHRDMMMVALKQRLGRPWDRPVDPATLHIPPGWNVEMLLARLLQQPLFSTQPAIPDAYLLHMLQASTLHSVKQNTTIMREGAFGHSIYCILDGACNLSITDARQKQQQLAILHPGDYMGEQSFLTGQVRNATATTISPAIILEIPEPVMQMMIEMVPPVQQFLQTKTHQHSLKAILRRLSLFQGVAEQDLDILLSLVQVRYYARNDLIFAEQPPTAAPIIHLLLDGFVKVTRPQAQKPDSERVLAYRQGGDYFVAGVDPIGDGQPVRVTTITRSAVAEIPYAQITPLFARYPEVDQRFQSRFAQYREAAQTAQTNPMPVLGKPAPHPEQHKKARNSLRALVTEGVVEGTEVLVIDLDRCVHCSECEEACARRHGHSRLNRTGMVVGNISVVTACRQCQDPVCMLCSRAGIARLPGGEVYITESCIGCGICAERCPYDNIDIVELAEQAQPSTWQRLQNFITKGGGKESGLRELPMYTGKATPPLLNPQRSSRDAVADMRKKIAVKCDLCAGYSNQACVMACPTGAVLRTNPNTFFGSTEDILSH
jgi:Fe-S-cluster-containing hydrogenase component 2/CRP-like cAMP-binding protein